MIDFIILTMWFVNDFDKSFKKEKKNLQKNKL